MATKTRARAQASGNAGKSSPSKLPKADAGAIFGCPGYFLGPKAVACVFGSEINITLPSARVAELVRTPGCRPFEARGRAMTGWMLVQPARLRALAEESDVLNEAIAYARSKLVLPPDSETPGRKVGPGERAKAPRAARVPSA
jgi:hypothetical protein